MKLKHVPIAGYVIGVVIVRTMNDYASAGTNRNLALLTVWSYGVRGI